MAAAAPAVDKSDPAYKVPVTVITGYLGSGKTTLLNHILTKEHGKKIAVIENEFGEIGIDDALVKQKFDAEEEIFEMNNGCICCTVRGDLVRILGKLIQRKATLDGIIIETTGLADPAPVAQTFFMDKSIENSCKLDAIVTVVDVKHIIPHLEEEKPEGAENEAVEQVVFADIMLLNKCDLIEEVEIVKVEEAVKKINPSVSTIRCVNAGQAKWVDGHPPARERCRYLPHERCTRHCRARTALRLPGYSHADGWPANVRVGRRTPFEQACLYRQKPQPRRTDRQLQGVPCLS